MKKIIKIIFILTCCFNNFLEAQPIETIEFEFRNVPTSTNSYKYNIYEDSVALFQRDLKIMFHGSIFQFSKTYTSNYVHVFSAEEKIILDSIIIVNNLNDISMYEERSYWGMTSFDSLVYAMDSSEYYNHRLCQWGMYWKVIIMRDYITFSIDLINYHNSGLEDLLNFVSSLIPVEKKDMFTR